MIKIAVSSLVGFVFFNEVILKPQVVNGLSCVSVQLAFNFPTLVWYLLKYFSFSVWWMEGAKNWDMWHLNSSVDFMHHL